MWVVCKMCGMESNCPNYGQDFNVVMENSTNKIKSTTYNMGFDKAFQLHLANWSNHSLDLDNFLVHLLEKVTW